MVSHYCRQSQNQPIARRLCLQARRGPGRLCRRGRDGAKGRSAHRWSAPVVKGRSGRGPQSPPAVTLSLPISPRAASELTCPAGKLLSGEYDTVIRPCPLPVVGLDPYENRSRSRRSARIGARFEQQGPVTASSTAMKGCGRVVSLERTRRTASTNGMAAGDGVIILREAEQRLTCAFSNAPQRID